MERMHRAEIIEPITNLVEEIPEHASHAIQRALGKTPAIRFATVLDFVAMLRRDWAPQANTATMVPDNRPTRPSHVFVIDAPKQRRGWLWGVGGASVVICAAAAYYWFGPQHNLLPISSDLPAVTTTSEVAEPAAPESENTTAPGSNVADSPSGTADNPATRVPQTTPPRPRVVRPVIPPAPVVNAEPETPLAPGELFINSRPWGRVYVDGEFVGNTPQAGLTLAAGVHTIRVIRDGFETYEAEIEIFSGRQRRITDIVLRPRQP
jgi:hypothetical protein